MAQAAVPLASLPQIQFFQPPSPASPYCKLKEMDELLDSVHESLSGARRLYQRTLKDFAVLCHDLWQREKAQGNRDGKGFRKGLRNAGIKVGRAYQAMKKFFPSDFPVKRKSLTKNKFSTLFATNKVVGLRFTGNLPEGKEALECIFALTPEEKAECTQSLNSVDPARLQQLFLQALKQAALCPSRPARPVSPPTANEVQNPKGLTASSQALEAHKSEIINENAVCNGISLNAVPAACPRPNIQKSEIKNQKSQIPHGTAALCPPSPLCPPPANQNQSLIQLAASSQKLVATKSQIANNDAVCSGIVLAPNPQKSAIGNQKSEISAIPHGLAASSQKLEAKKSEIKNQKSQIPSPPTRQMLRFQKRKQEKEQRRLERFLDQLLLKG